jgi:hypothetical protein
MGGNQSNLINESVTEMVSNFITKNETFIKQDFIQDTKIKQEMLSKIGEFHLKNCSWNHNLETTIITKTDIKTEINVSSDQAADLLREIKNKLNNDISQEMKGLPMGNNDNKVQDIINNITNTKVQNIVNSSFSSSFSQINDIDQKMQTEIKYVDCDDSIASFNVGIDYDSAVSQASQLISKTIQKASELNKVSDVIDNKIKQKNIGFDLTMVAIVAIIAFLIYIMAESGTLGQLMPGGGGGKSSSGGGVSSVVRNPVTSRSALLAQVEKRMNSVFGAVGKQKAWWVGL